MIHHGDCLDVMAAMEPASVDAIVTDPPYGIRFMGKAWDGAAIEEATRKRQAKRDATDRVYIRMRHLVRLVTPPDGTVLDPFLGSGTTALAAYVAIAEARLNGTQRALGLGA